jgi:hypothetical protein
MTDEDDEDPGLVRALGALPAEVPPRDDLEERTVSELRRAGVFRRSGRPFVVWVTRLAAAVALVVTGYAWATWGTGRSGGEVGPRYVLLLHEDESFQVPPGGGPALVAEYRNWALGLRHEQRLLAGEELDPAQVLLPSGSTLDLNTVTGFFVIRAKDDQEALVIAESCPHLRHGGRVELRRIRPT